MLVDITQLRQDQPLIRKNVPLALQVLNDISAGMESGELLRENRQLPSEDELSRRFDVSRATVREALSRLEQRGSVIRQHGVGTFAAAQDLILDSGLEQLESIDTLARRIGLETQAGASEIIERQASEQELARLGLEPESQVLAVSRQILADGKPVAYLVDVIPTNYLRAHDLNTGFRGSVLDVFLRRADPVLSHALTDMTVEPVGALIAQKLNLGSAEIILKLESLLFSREGRKIDASLSYFVPGYFRFHMVRRVAPSEIHGPQSD